MIPLRIPVALASHPGSQHSREQLLGEVEETRRAVLRQMGREEWTQQ